jgi:hypothetical protein
MDLRKRGLDWSLIFDFDLCFMMVGVGWRREYISIFYILFYCVCCYFLLFGILVESQEYSSFKNILNNYFKIFIFLY